MVILERRDRSLRSDEVLYQLIELLGGHPRFKGLSSHIQALRHNSSGLSHHFNLIF
jgi:hypothetical protein